MPDGLGELIEATARGDRAAYTRLVQAWRLPLHRYLRSMLHGSPAADDALQETLLGVYRAAPMFRGDGSARAWLYGIARRQAHRQTRRRVGEPAAPESLDTLGAAAGWGEITPEAMASAAEDRARLHRALESLDDDDREIVTLKDLEQLTNPEVAALLEITLPAVKSRLHRARLRLMARLREEVADVQVT